jgi:SAM-dependent methyltransferase
MARALLRRLGRRLAPDATSGADQWQRVVLNDAVARHLAGLGPASLTAYEISGAAHAHRGWRRFESLDYPEFDLCAPLAPREPADVVLCEQVIEHVPDPCAAVRNLRALSRPGGHVIVSTPFLIRVHEEWGMQDYWRFTPRGLRTLLEHAGLEVEQVGHWGNRRVIAGNLDRWPAHRRWLALHDEPKLPVQVWAFARNPRS